MGWLQERLARFGGAPRAEDKTETPAVVIDWLSRGNAALGEGKVAEAARCYEQGIVANPTDPALRLNHGFALLELGQYEPAADRLTQALALRRPGDDILHDIHFLLGRARAALGQADLALSAFDAAVRSKPDFVEPIAEALRLLQGLQRHGEAAEWARRLVSLQASTDNEFVLGQELALGGRLAEAAEVLGRVCAAEPAAAEASAIYAGVLLQLNRFEAALAETDRSLGVSGATPPALVNRAVALGKMGRLQEALAIIEQVLVAEPDRRDALVNQVALFTQCLRLDEAIAVAHRGLEQDAQDVDLHWLLAICHLLRGEFDAGWREHEWRLRHPAFRHKAMQVDAPRWQGESLQGRTLFLHSEQGFGDNIQFLRFVPKVADMGGTVLLHVTQPLEDLVVGMLPPNCRLVRQGEPMPEMDFHLSLMSLPAVLATTLATIPAEVPYLRADPAAVERWRSRLGSESLNVGITWAGNPGHVNDRNRSMSLSTFRQVAADGCRFVTVQPDVRDADHEELADWNEVEHLGRELRDFGQTAGLMQALDLVITVDTSVAHLAGALGRPVWVLLPHAPDWRWMLDRSDSPWYPTARLYRQPAPGDWASVLRQLRADLAAHAAARVR